MSDQAKQAPMVNGSQVLAAGFAATTAAFVTSRFGVAGTLLGAALTAMIITGGSAILKAYLEGVTGNVRKVPSKLRQRRNRWMSGRSAEPSDTMPARPDLRDNFMGRMRAALGWFSHLPPLTRRSILIKGLIAAVVAFVIGMAAVYAVEKGIGNSLSCGLWAKCPEGATPGIHLGGGDGTGAKSSFSLGRAKTTAAPAFEGQDPAFRQNPSFQQGAPGGQQQQQPAVPDNEPGREIFGPDQPAESVAPVQPGSPNSASPAPGEQPLPGGAPGQNIDPSDASPAPAD